MVKKQITERRIKVGDSSNNLLLG